MKSSIFKAKLLEIICPSILELYEQEFIPKFLNISKPAFQSQVAKDESNPMRNYDWAFLYLDEKRLYEHSRAELITGLKSKFYPQAPDIPEPEEIEDKLANLCLRLTKRCMRNFSFDDDHDFNDLFSQIGFDMGFFTTSSIAQFYNSLSVIQSNKRINDLLVEFIENGEQLSLVKAVKVDPSVLELEEIKNSINQLDPETKHKLENKLQSAKSLPHLSPDKRKKYLLLAVFLNLTSSMGYLSGSYPIPNAKLQDIAIKLDLIPEYFVDDDFRKLAAYYRNR